RIMYLAAQPTLSIGARNCLCSSAKVSGLRAPLLRRRDARAQGGDRFETRVAQAERHVDVAARKLVERLPAHAMHDFAERDEIDVAIDEARARRIAQPLRCESLNRLVVARPLLREIEIRREARTVRQQLLDGYLLAPLAFDFRDVAHERIIQTHLSALD